MTDRKKPAQGGDRPRQRARSAYAQHAQRTQERSYWRFIWLGVGVIAAAVIGYFVFDQVQLAAASGEVVPNEGAQHVPGNTPLQYNTWPPASGPHFDQAQSAGFYNQEVSEGNWVHALEHGYIVVIYNPSRVGESGLAALRAMYNQVPPSSFGTRKMIVFPSSKLQNPVTALAWDRRLALQSVDTEAITKFYRARVDKGPERVP